MAIEAAIIDIRQRADGADRSAADLIGLASGDIEAFERVMRCHEQRVLSTAWRLLGSLEEAQDAAQEVFLRLYRYRQGFDAQRAIEPWLYRVTVNVCRDLGRRRRLRQTVSIEQHDAVQPLESSEPHPDAAAALAEERRIAEAALATLAYKERAALVLRDIQGLSTAEVAAAMGSSETTVRSQICRARLKIRKYRDLEHRQRSLSA